MNGLVDVLVCDVTGLGAGTILGLERKIGQPVIFAGTVVSR